MNLKEYSCKISKRRKFSEEKDIYRNNFQIDISRIIHSDAFKRLEKTQVFPAGKGKKLSSRTRITHSLEVALLSKTIGQNLGLNSDLCEAIALSHDLGHPPFGHYGQEVLDKIMKKVGKSFEHNKQTLRILEKIEKKNENFSGLNLSLEVLEGLQKHEKKSGFEIGSMKTLEAELVNISDFIAYTSGDLEDGINNKILKISDLKKYEIIKNLEKKIKFKLTKNNIKRFCGNLINLMVSDLIENSLKNFEINKIKTLENVENCKNINIKFSDDFFEILKPFREYLFTNFYKNEKIVKKLEKAGVKIEKVFDFYKKNPRNFVKEYFSIFENNFLDKKIIEKNLENKEVIKKFLEFKNNEEIFEVYICDLISGITDFYLEKIFKKISKK